MQQCRNATPRYKYAMPKLMSELKAKKAKNAKNEKMLKKQKMPKC